MDWTPCIGRYAELVPIAREFWKTNAADYGQPDAHEDCSPGAIDGLNPEQRLLFDQFVNHYQSTLDGHGPPQLLLQVDGRGGTGKSHVIRLMSARLDSMARAHGKPSIVARAAPTGVAANGINGSTVHSLLKLPITKGDLTPLAGGALSALHARLRQYRLERPQELSSLRKSRTCVNKKRRAA